MPCALSAFYSRHKEMSIDSGKNGNFFAKSRRNRKKFGHKKNNDKILGEQRRKQTGLFNIEETERAASSFAKDGFDRKESLEYSRRIDERRRLVRR